MNPENKNFYFKNFKMDFFEIIKNSNSHSPEEIELLKKKLDEKENSNFEEYQFHYYKIFKIPDEKIVFKSNDKFVLDMQPSSLQYFKKILDPSLKIKNFLYYSLKNYYNCKIENFFPCIEFEDQLPIYYSEINTISKLPRKFEVIKREYEGNGAIISILEGFNINSNFLNENFISNNFDDKNLLNIILKTEVDLIIFIQMDYSSEEVKYKKIGNYNNFFIFLFAELIKKQDQIQTCFRLLKPKKIEEHWNYQNLKKETDFINSAIENDRNKDQIHNKSNKINLFNTKNFIKELKKNIVDYKTKKGKILNDWFQFQFLVDYKPNHNNEYIIMGFEDKIKKYIKMKATGFNTFVYTEDQILKKKKFIEEFDENKNKLEKLQMPNMKKKCFCEKGIDFDYNLRSFKDILGCCIIKQFKKNENDFIDEIKKEKCIELIESIISNYKDNQEIIRLLEMIKQKINKQIETEIKRDNETEKAAKNLAQLSKEPVIPDNLLKNCPSCRIPIEKIDGCNFICCPSFSCLSKKYFCYICLKQLRPNDKISHYPEGIYSNFCKNTKK